MGQIVIFPKRGGGVGGTEGFIFRQHLIFTCSSQTKMSLITSLIPLFVVDVVGLGSSIDICPLL